MPKSKVETGPIATRPKRSRARLARQISDESPVSLSEVFHRSVAYERGLAATNSAQRDMLEAVSPQFARMSPFVIHAGVLKRPVD